MEEFIQNFIFEFNRTFIAKDRYSLFLEGLKNTITIALTATLIGVILGFTIAIIKHYAKDNKKLKPLEIICNIYTTVIRGTPVVVQLLIMYFIILVNTDNSVIIAILTFGFNSGAYVSEIVRAGINAVDKGQAEAGKALGLNKMQTMRYIIIPQAFKNILPALGNEFIALLKETAVAGYVPIIDLTKAGAIVRSQTYSAFFPLLSVAAMYLTLVMILTWVLKIVERRLSTNDRD